MSYTMRADSIEPMEPLPIKPVLLWFPVGLAPLVCTNSFYNSDPSEVTVLTSVSQLGLYVTQQSHPAGCQVCLSCRIYVPLCFC